MSEILNREKLRMHQVDENLKKKNSTRLMLKTPLCDCSGIDGCWYNGIKDLNADVPLLPCA